jgi:hypothetical protein
MNLEGCYHIHKRAQNSNIILCEMKLVFGYSQKFVDKVAVVFLGGWGGGSASSSFHTFRPFFGIKVVNYIGPYYITE